MKSVVGQFAWLRATPLVVWGVLAAASTWVLMFNPTDRAADPSGACLWHAATGINGPTCGGTRMFYYLIHGNLVEAFRHHAVALVGMAYGLYVLSVATLNLFSRVSIRSWRPGRWTVVTYIVVFVVYSTVLRNLPWAPFDWFNIPYLT
jgi:hypothetical protein